MKYAIIGGTGVYGAGEKFETAFMEQKPAQYLYHSDSDYVFMDMNTYEQTTIDKSLVCDAAAYLKDGMQVNMSLCDGSIIGVELPTSVILKIVHTEPGVKGDTAKAANKPAETESGTVIQVPLFIKNGDSVKVDTRTGKYLGRA